MLNLCLARLLKASLSTRLLPTMKTASSLAASPCAGASRPTPPVGAQHRIENPGRIPMVFIEVQTGPYVGEDDIIRYEDRYARA